MQRTNQYLLLTIPRTISTCWICAEAKNRYVMIRATSGKECLAIAEEKKPDIILLDIQMPEMDGFETIKRLRAKSRNGKRSP